MSDRYTRRAMHEVCEISSSKRIFAADYQPEGVPFFRGKEITERYNGALNVSTELFISRNKYEEIRAKHGVPKPGDLLLTSVGTLGSTYVVKPGDEFYFKDGNITWFRNFKGLDGLYLHYWLSSPMGKAEQRKCTIGSSQSAYTIVLLKEMRIELPPLARQRRIASILSTYDDLIENNTRRIAILEEIARRIYEEWFVQFRFPGHEQVKMVESELGGIPEGWTWQRLRDIALEVRDSVKPQTLEPSTPYVGLEHIPRRSIALSEWGSSADIQSTKLRFSKGDILFGKIRPYFHKVAVAPIDGVSSSDAIVIRARSPDWYPLTLATVSSDAFVAVAAQSANGTKMPRANWSVLLDYKVPIPDPGTLRLFNDFMEGTINFIGTTVLKNRNLRATRDLLLPKLISGELDVSTIAELEEIIAA